MNDLKDKLKSIAFDCGIPACEFLIDERGWGTPEDVILAMQSAGYPFALESGEPGDWRASFDFDTGAWEVGETMLDAVVKAAYARLNEWQK